MGKLDIIIVNWNSGNWLARCVHSIFTTDNPELIAKVIVVDNASTDDSLQQLPKHPQLHVLPNAENKGFAAACNQGIDAGDAQYVVMVNPDVMVEPNTLPGCYAFMEGHERIQICGVMQRNEADEIQPSCARFPTPARYLYDAMALTRIWPRVFKPATLMTDWDHRASCEVDQIMGSFMFIRRSIFNTLGKFDERFFVYYEELDLSKRLAEMGGVSYYIHALQITHAGGGTTASVKAFRLFLSLSSRLLYAKKHFSKTGYLFTVIVTNTLEWVTRLVWALYRDGWHGVQETIKGYKMLWFNIDPRRQSNTPA